MKKILKSIVGKFIGAALAASMILTTAVPPAFAAAEILTPSYPLSLPVIRGLQFDPAEPLDFNFVVDLADEASVSEDDALKLVRYFMAAVAVPEKDVWVNLSPDGEERIIADNFGATEAGQDLLGQDMLLKKLSASFLHPDRDLGKKFWDTAYQKAYETYGVTDLPQDALQRIWIVPQRAVIDEFHNAAYISESRLKVLTENMYKGAGSSSSLISDIILPAIEEEINTGERFAVLRQIYHSMILGIWFKNKLQDHAVNRVYRDSSKVEGIDFVEAGAETQTFESYLDIFRKGLYDEIREDYDPVRGEMVLRKYVSGGFGLPAAETWMRTQSGNNRAMLSWGKTILLSVAFFFAASFADDVQGQSTTPSLPETNKVLVLNQMIGDQDKPYLDYIRTFATTAKVVGLNGTLNPDNGNQEHAFDAYLIERDGDKIWNTPGYDWKKQAYVVLAQYELKAEGYQVKVNGKLDSATREALRDRQAQQGTISPTPNSPVSLTGDTLSVKAPEGVFAQRELQFQNQIANDTVHQTNYADSLETLRSLQWTQTYQSLSQKSVEQDSAIQQMIADTNNVAAGEPPPDTTKAPGAWTMSLYYDFGAPVDGRFPPYHYGVSGGSYSQGPWSIWGNIETGGYLQGDTIAWTAAPYAGFSYVVNPQWKFGVERRFPAKGITPVTILSGTYTSPDGYALIGAYSLTNNPDENGDLKRSNALMLSVSGQIGKFFIQPYLYTMSDATSGFYTDFGLAASYQLTSNSTLSFERNPSAAYATYNYAPNLPLRLNYNHTVGKWTISPYLTSNDYNLQWGNLGGGLAAKYVLTNTPSSTTSASPVLPVFSASAYTDAWYSKETNFGQYGQYALNGILGPFSTTSLMETGVTYVPDEEGGGKYVTTAGFYNQVGVQLFQGPVSVALHVGHRSNVLGGINPVNYVRATGSVGPKLAYDIWSSRTQTTDAEGQTVNVSGQAYNIIFTPWSWLSVAPTIVTGHQGGQSLNDWGFKTTLTFKNGAQFSYAHNPNATLALVNFAPDQKGRIQLTTSTDNLGNSGLALQIGGYVASNTAGFKDPMIGFTTNVTFSAKPDQVSFKEFMTDSTMTMMELRDLPKGAETRSVSYGENFFGFDVDLLRFAGSKLTRQDFMDHYKDLGKKAAIKRWKKFHRDWLNLQDYDGGPVQYTQGLAYGVEVTKAILQESGYYTGLLTSTFDEAVRKGLYTVQTIGSESAEEVMSTGGAGDLNEDKAMVAGQPNKSDVGGIDLSESRSAIETRVHGTFNGLDHLDTQWINPNAFNGFGVRLIRMAPIFDLSQIFTPEEEPVMISQL